MQHRLTDFTTTNTILCLLLTVKKTAQWPNVKYNN